MIDHGQIIRNWIGSGSINIFGPPFSGKDTVGNRLAAELQGVLLSSGEILRQAQAEDEALKKEMNSGALANTDKFRSIVLPYFAKEELNGKPLIMSSIGRWEGEEHDVIEAAKNAGHPIKVALQLEISPEAMEQRRQLALESGDRGGRGDDNSPEVLQKRIDEFNEKTLPVLATYEKLGLLVKVSAEEDRDTVFYKVLEAISDFSIEN
jgi:adenylate kinase